MSFNFTFAEEAYTIKPTPLLLSILPNMEIDFIKLMPSKSDDELQTYIDNRLKYNPDAVFAAIDELKKRGRIYTDLEIETIKSDLEKQQEINKQRTPEIKFNRWKKNVVDDIDAPMYFSEQAIYVFSIFFGVFFGSVLMAINLRKTETKKGRLEVIAFGIVYTIAQLWILSFIPRNSGLTLVSSMGGALIINYFFWKKYIGTETKYRTKPIWIPLIVGIVILIPIVFAAIYGAEI